VREAGRKNSALRPEYNVIGSDQEENNTAEYIISPETKAAVVLPVPETPQSKVKESKVKESKEKKTDNSEGGAPAEPSPPAQKLADKQEKAKQRAKDFYKELTPFIDLYPKAMLRAFFDYWSELNKSKTKMKIEMQETWDLAKRLSTWERNEFKFSKNKDPGTSKANGTNAPAAKSFDEKINYLLGRYAEGALDDRLLLPEYYDKLVTTNRIPLGDFELQTGETIELKKINGLKSFFKNVLESKQEAV
jgi:hypothetical protein